MAALATVYTEFADNGNSRTYTTPGSTVTKPKLVIQKRKVPTGNQSVAELSGTVIHGTEDDAGAVLAQKVSMSAVVRYPVDGQATDIAAALVIFRDFVQSDEFEASITSHNFVE